VITVELRGSQAVDARLERVIGAVKDRAAFYARVGRRYVNTEIPLIFRQSGPGWPPLRMRRGQPLLDRHLLERSIVWKVRGDDLVVGTPHPAGKTHNQGMTIRPKKANGWLMIPLVPPLTESQRVMNPRDFHGAFFLFKGPEGPGLYRKSQTATAFDIRSRGASKRRAGTRGIERIFAGRKSVRIPRRQFLPRDVLAATAIREAKKMIEEAIK
jgi:phage gpG-like protein